MYHVFDFALEDCLNLENQEMENVLLLICQMSLWEALKT